MGNMQASISSLTFVDVQFVVLVDAHVGVDEVRAEADVEVVQGRRGVPAGEVADDVAARPMHVGTLGGS